MSAHEFPNDPLLVVVCNQDNRYESFCRCGYRVHAPTENELPVEQGQHLNEVSTIVSESARGIFDGR